MNVGPVFVIWYVDKHSNWFELNWFIYVYKSYMIRTIAVLQYATHFIFTIPPKPFRKIYKTKQDRDITVILIKKNIQIGRLKLSTEISHVKKLSRRVIQKLFYPNLTLLILPNYIRSINELPEALVDKKKIKQQKKKDFGCYLKHEVDNGPNIRYKTVLFCLMVFCFFGLMLFFGHLVFYLFGPLDLVY